MTKDGFFAIRTGRDHVADLYLPILNNDSVDEQLYQLSALNEAQFIKRGAHTLAKRLDTVS